MGERRDYTVHCLSEALGPITHMSGTAGNEGIVAREDVVTPAGIVRVPMLSGNALRHRCIREPMAMWLIDRYGLRGQLDLQRLNFLLHGGNLTQSTARENTDRIAEMREAWPMLGLLGGALPDQILSGTMDVWRGTLVCEENRRALAGLPVPDERIHRAERCLTGYQYTRSDARKTGLAQTSDLDESNLMIYSGQAVARGALFHHGFVLRLARRLDLGCLLLALRLWQAGGGTIGGSARIGHGRLGLSLVGVEDDGEAVAEYVQTVDDMRDRALAWLDDAFTAAPKKKGKQKTLESA